MFKMEDKENDPKQENEKAVKLAVESPAQKPRRSVLKEFDPFAPDSPCPPKQRIKTPSVIIDDDEEFEDAETSLTTYVCPKTKNINIGIEDCKKSPPGNTELLLIPNLKGNCPKELINPNDTADLSYIEAVENLSQVDELPIDKTSSFEEVEFNTNKNTRHPQVSIQNSINNSFNINTSLDEPYVLNKDLIMVDSLEQTFNADSEKLTSTVENTRSPDDLKKNQSVETCSEKDPSNAMKNNSDRVIDNLELPDSQQKISVVGTAIGKENISHQEMDSLKALKPEENLKSNAANDNLISPQLAATFETNSISPEIPNGKNTDKISTSLSHLDKTFETLPTIVKAEFDVNIQRDHSANNDVGNFSFEGTSKALEVPVIENSSHINHTSPNNTNSSEEHSETLQVSSSDVTISKSEQLQHGQTNAFIKTLDSPVVNTPKMSGEQEETLVPERPNIITATSNDEKVQLNKTFEAPPSDKVESKTDEPQSSINLSNSLNTPECDKTFETLPKENDVTNVENAVQATSINFDMVVDNFKLDQTFNADANKPIAEENSNGNSVFTSNNETGPQKEDNMESTPLNKTFDTPCEVEEVGENAEDSKGETVTNEEQDKTKLQYNPQSFDNNKVNTPSEVEKVKENVEYATTHTVINEEPDTAKQEHAQSIINDKVGASSEDEKVVENVKNDKEQIVKNGHQETTSQEYNHAQSIPFEIEKVENAESEHTATADKQDTTTQELDSAAITITENGTIEDKSVSLEIRNSEETNSKLQSSSSYVISCSENVNLTFMAEEQAAESNRVMEALAQSLNQTIDVEESAIEEYLNCSKSTHSSGDLNVTIENVEEGSGNQECVIGDPKEMQSEVKPDELKRKNVLERKETEEFEDLERQCNEKAQLIEACVREVVEVEKAIQKENLENEKVNIVDEEYSRVFLRQDTQEFEALEQACNASVQNIDNCDIKKLDNHKSITECNGEVEGDIKFKREKEQMENKVLEKQDTKEVEHLERECKTDIRTPKDGDDSNLNQEVTKNSNGLKTEESVTSTCFNEGTELKTQEQIKASECTINAASVADDQIKTEKPGEQHLSEIKLNRDEKNPTDTECNNVNNISNDTINVTINGNHNITSTKTDKTVAEPEIEESIAIINKNEVPATNEHTITKSKSKLECRPSTRSMRNKTQVIEKPVFTSDEIKQQSNNDGNNDTTLIPNERVDEQLTVYKTRSDELRSQVDRLQNEIDTIKKDNMKKDKSILSFALDLEVERDTALRFRRLLEEYEQVMARQNTELERLKAESEVNSKHFISTEMAFANVFEKYEKTKTVVEAYRKNEEILQKNIQGAEDQLTKLDAKCSVMKEQCTEQIKKAQEQVMHEKEKYRQDIAKLQAMVKRLEIKASSLETSLKQKTEECRALSALCDDITGKPM